MDALIRWIKFIKNVKNTASFFALLVTISFLVVGCEGRSELIINNNSNSQIDVFYCRIESIDTMYYNYLSKENGGNFKLRDMIQVVYNPSTEEFYDVTPDSIGGCCTISIPSHNSARLLYGPSGFIFNSDGVSNAIGKILVKRNGKVLYRAEKQNVKKLFIEKGRWGKIIYELNIDN